MKKWNVAVMGATGAVGLRFLSILEERNFPIKSLRLLASERSAGKILKVKGEDHVVDELSHDSFDGMDLVLSSAGAKRSIEFLPSAVKAGCVCIDNSSAFRMDKDVPLVVPEVNPQKIKKHKGIIANPNCSTIQLVTALYPLHKRAKIERIVVTTYQSVSGAGSKNIEELKNQSLSLAKSTDMEQIGRHAAASNFIKEFPYQIAFNLIPHIDQFVENGYTKEEMKLINETRKIMDAESMAITATAVRVPVYYAHSESVNITTEKSLDHEEAKAILADSPGVTMVDDPLTLKYPMPIDAEGKDDVFVGRIRKDESIKNGLNLWVVSDNLRKGAALNAIQIAELL